MLFTEANRRSMSVNKESNGLWFKMQAAERRKVRNLKLNYVCECLLSLAASVWLESCCSNSCNTKLTIDESEDTQAAFTATCQVGELEELRNWLTDRRPDGRPVRDHICNWRFGAGGYQSLVRMNCWEGTGWLATVACSSERLTFIEGYSGIGSDGQPVRILWA